MWLGCVGWGGVGWGMWLGLVVCAQSAAAFCTRGPTRAYPGPPFRRAHLPQKYGFDACIDYKALSSAEELKAALKVHAPAGIDMYFEVCVRVCV